jgi:hypothetical protein
MKKIIFTFLSCFLAFTAFAQFPFINAGFETWTTTSGYDVCTGWGNVNQFFTQNGAPQCLFKSSDKHSGSFSAEARTVNALGDTAAGFIAFGKIVDGSIEPTTAIGKIPDTFSFWYNYAPVLDDSFFVLISFTKWVPGTGRTTVSNTWFAGGSSNAAWANKKIKLTLNGNTQVDSFFVSFSSSGGDNNLGGYYKQIGSVLRVDDVSFIGNVVGAPNAIASAQMNKHFEIYPTMTSDVININGTDKKEQIEIYNANGARLIEQNAEASFTKVDVSGLAQGIYFVKISGEDKKVLHTCSISVR